jgi:hypothetical protein
MRFWRSVNFELGCKAPASGVRFHERLATARIVVWQFWVLRVWFASADFSLWNDAAQPTGKG